MICPRCQQPVFELPRSTHPNSVVAGTAEGDIRERESGEIGAQWHCPNCGHEWVSGLDELETTSSRTPEPGTDFEEPHRG